jgi:hypothetical protein
VIRGDTLDEFIEEVFGNILEIRECNRRLLEVMYVRQREEAPVIKRIGDIFLGAATEFRVAYPSYVGRLPLAEKRMKEETESNPEFRLFLEVILFLGKIVIGLTLANRNARVNLRSIRNPFASISSIC